MPPLLEVIRKHEIGLVVPTIDTELPLLARHSDDLALAGALALVSSAAFVDVCGDKATTAEAFSARGIDVPRSWLPEDLAGDAAPELPDHLVVKPRNGSSSKDVHLIDAAGGRDVAMVPHPIVQERLTGPEVTVDALLDLDGRPVHYVPRTRLKTLGGESIQGVTLPHRRARPVDRARARGVQRAGRPRPGDAAVLPHRARAGADRGQPPLRRRLPADPRRRRRLPGLAARPAAGGTTPTAVRRLPRGALHDALHGRALHRRAPLVIRALRGVVLDLDDTLYLERDYVRSGFAAVAATSDPGATPTPQVADHLWRRFTSGERGSHFDDLLASDPALAGRVEVPELVEVYRHHAPDIRLLPGVRDLLAGLRAAGRRTAVISDGALAGQQAKVRALGLEDLVDGPVVLTDTWGREGWKPHPRAFVHVEEAWGCPRRTSSTSATTRTRTSTHHARSVGRAYAYGWRDSCTTRSRTASSPTSPSTRGGAGRGLSVPPRLT